MKFNFLRRTNTYPFYILTISLFTFFSIAVASRRFGSPDDFCTFSAGFFSDGCMGTEMPRTRDFIHSAFIQAESQSRFYQIPMYLIAQVVISNSIVTTLSKFFLSFLICLSLMLATKTIFGTKIALISSFIFAGGYILFGAYNGATALPGWFNLGLSTFWLSIYFGHKYILSLNKLFLIYSVITCIISLLSYESYFVILAVVLFSLLLLRKFQFKNNLGLITLQRYLLCLLIAYLLIYWYYKQSFPSNYSGFKFGSFNPLVVSETLLKLTLASPITTYYRVFSGISKWSFISAGTILMYYVLRKIVRMKTVDNRSKHGDVRFTSLLIILSLAPNFPLSLSERYQGWADVNPMYINAFTSFTFISIALSLLVIKLWEFNKRILLEVLLIIISGSITSSTVQNFYYFKDSIEINQRISNAERSISKLSVDELLYVANKENKSLGAYPYRYSEAYWFAVHN